MGAPAHRAVTAVSHDRPQVLHDRADLAALLPSLVARASLVDPSLASVRPTRRPTVTPPICARSTATAWVCHSSTPRVGVRFAPRRAAYRHQPAQSRPRVLGRARSSGRSRARSQTSAHVVPVGDHARRRFAALGARHDGRRRATADRAATRDATVAPCAVTIPVGDRQRRPFRVARASHWF